MKNNSQKGFAPSAVIIIVALVLIAGGIAYFSKDKSSMVEEEDTMIKPDENAMMDDVINKEENEMMEDDSAAMKYSGAVLAGISAPLLDFKKADYDAAVKTDKTVVLFFYADWCPICRAEFPLMQEAFNGLTTEDVVGFRVNYNDDNTDSDERDLAREFGVAYQHTKVFVKNGERILKSPEGWSKERYESEINKAIIQ